MQSKTIYSLSRPSMSSTLDISIKYKVDAQNEANEIINKATQRQTDLLESYLLGKQAQNCTK